MDTMSRSPGRASCRSPTITDASASGYKIPYGAVLSVADGDAVTSGQMVASWDPHTHPVVSEVAGRVRFSDAVDGVTVQSQVDEVTGLARIEVMDPKQRSAAAKDLRPMVRLVDENEEELRLPGTDAPAHYVLSPGAVIVVQEGDEVGIGDVVARMPQESSMTRDITGGLPRVADLFEARKPKEAAVLAEVSGTVSFGKDTKGKQRLVITDEEGVPHEILVPKWRHILVFEGEHVEQGEPVVDGMPSPHDILRLLGVSALANYIVNEGAGGLSAAGREDQRQAHRGHRASDAAQGRDCHARWNEVPARGAARSRQGARGEREGVRRGW